MKFIKSSTDLYLENTEIENLFIYEYMIPAKGEYVKVYLLARMYAERGSSITNEELAKELGIPDGDILNAWDYWESKKVIIKHFKPKSKLDYDIEFVSLKRLMFGSGKNISQEKSVIKKLNETVATPELALLFTQIEQSMGRTLGGKELHDVRLWAEEWGLEDPVILKACDLCVKNKKKGDHAYLAGIVKNWYEKGLFDLKTLEEYLAENDKRHNLYKRVFRALGFRGRYPSEEEARIMDIWFDEYLFDISVVLDACKKTAGISSPSISYINAILKSWHEDGDSGSAGNRTGTSGKKKTALSEAMKSYELTRKENSKLHEKRVEEIYQLLPRIREIDLDVKELNPKMMKMLLAGQNKTSVYKTMERELENLRKEKIHILKGAGYEEDYLESIYTCRQCKDTGFLDNGEKCVCLIEKIGGKN